MSIEPSGNAEEQSRVIVRVLTDDANLVNIRTFVVAANYLSFKAAAHFLCLTPGAVSHRIAKLEEIVGFPLFNRLTRSVALTPEGERLKNICQHAFQSFREEVVNQVGQGNFSALTLYSHHSIAFAWLIPRLTDFHRLHPAVQIHVQTGNEVVAFTAANPVDLAVYYADGNFAGLESQHFMDEDVFPVCSPAYAAQHELHNAPERLEHCTLVADAAAWHFSAPTAEWRVWCEAQNIRLPTDTPCITFDTAAAGAVAACHHMGVSIGRRRIVQAMLDEGKLINPFPALPALHSPFGYYAVWPRSATMPPKLEIFLRWLKDMGRGAN